MMGVGKVGNAHDTVPLLPLYRDIACAKGAKLHHIGRPRSRLPYDRKSAHLFGETCVEVVACSSLRSCVIPQLTV